jgi:hypothetical protein
MFYQNDLAMRNSADVTDTDYKNIETVANLTSGNSPLVAFSFTPRSKEKGRSMLFAPTHNYILHTTHASAPKG